MNLDERVKRGYMLAEREELFNQTPIEVWLEYKAEGYTLAEAISMEFSYL